MIRRLLRLLAFAAIFGALVLALAGRTDLPRLWWYLGTVWGMMLFALAILDPAVVKERLKPGQKTADPVALLAIRVLSAATIVVSVLDAGRLHRADTVPPPVSGLALVAMAGGFLFAFLSIRANRFFVPQVRIQSERGHHVVDRGPYSVVRHPGYAAMVVVGPCGALAIGSWLGFAVGLMASVAFVYRTAGEDRFLRANLEGYADYAARVRHRLVPGLWVLVLMVAVPAGLAAQDTTQTPRPPQRPFQEGGQYDRPYLTNLLGRTALGGYAEAHVRYEEVDGAKEEFGFVPKRFNLFTATQVSDFVRIGAELEFEDGTSEILLEYAAIDVAIHPALAFRAGMLLVPLGKFNLAHDSPRNEFTDRPVVSTDLLGVALSEPGVGLFGRFGTGGTGRLTYEVYAVNGLDAGLIDESPDGTRIPQGRGNIEDNNASPSFVGRVAFSPRVGWELGLSAHHGAYNVYEQDGLAVDERRDLTIAAVDAEATVAGVRLMGEAALVNVDISPGLVGIYAERQRGFYLQAVRPFGQGWVTTMPQSSFALAARVDVVDFDAAIPGDDTRQLSLGLNFRPTQDTAIKLNWVRGQTRDRFNNSSNHARLLASVATYF